MRRQGITRETRRGRVRRKGQGGDTAPVGSVTGQPARVQFSCRDFLCVRLGFIWAAAGAGNITRIAPFRR
jgi:hypothetical protein